MNSEELDRSSLTNKQLLALINDKEREIFLLQEKLKSLEQKAISSSSNGLEIFSLKEIIALMPGNVFWKNKEGVYLGCNNTLAKFLGFKSPDEIIGKRNEDFIPKPYAQILDKADQDIMNANEGRFIEEVGFDIHQKPAIFFTQKIPLNNACGEAVGLLGISMDITERKRIEKELSIAKEKAEAASLAKSEFVANMSHDIKTPLAGIIGISELLTYRLKNEEREFAQTLLTAGQQLMNFFNNCLEVFKFENGNIAAIKEYFKITSVLEEIQSLFGPIIQSKQLSLFILFGDNLPAKFFGCKTGIYRVLLNLIANAIKFTDAGSITISINTTQTNDRNQCNLILTVADTGIGIPEEKQKIIFERFIRLVPSYKGTYEGSGIGLYFVQRFISEMGGTIHVNSKVGVGSEFIASIPIEISDKIAVPALRPVKPPLQPSDLPSSDLAKSTIHILLVEDNLITQKIQSLLLVSMDYEVDVASSGEQALEIFMPGKYDLIFLDIGLPGIPGNVVSKQIRELEKNTGYHVPIIALTAHINDNIDHYCQVAGIESVCSKPLSREQAKYFVEYHCKSDYFIPQ